MNKKSRLDNDINDMSWNIKENLVVRLDYSSR